MPGITITDGSSLNITSQPMTPALAHYLREGLVFALKADSSVFKQAADKAIGDIDAGSFPVSLSPELPSRGFAVSSATLTLQPSLEASIDVLTGNKASDLQSSLGPNFPAIPALVSFAFSAELDSGPSGTVGDFSFGLLSGREIKISNTCPVQKTELLKDAVQEAMSGLTLPHDLDDVRALPEQHICTVEGHASVKFTASVRYSILNNTLATAPFEVLSNALNVKVTSGAKLQVTVTHSNTHQMTIASLGKGVVRVSVSLAEEADVEESFDFSIGASGNIGGTDALQFLVEQVSGAPDKDLAQIRNFLSGQEQSDLNSQIKSVIQGATKGGISASLHDAFKQSQEDKSLFIYEVDLNALDSISSPAVESALKGDFTQMTALGSGLAGIKEIKSVSTLTLTKSHTLTLHLLGLLNFSDVSTFMKKAKVARVGDTDDVVLAATDIKVVQNTVNPDHLREVLTKSAMVTIAADSSPQNPDFAFQMIFFMKKAGIKNSDLHQIANSLAFVSSPDATTASALLRGTSSRPDVLVYLALKLDKNLSTAMFKTPDQSAFLSSDDFVRAGQKAMAAILADDPDSSNRMRLFSIDLASWKQLRELGAAEKVQAALTARGITNPASWTDFVSIDWWAQAMGKMASALQQGKSLGDAQKAVLKDSQAGFDVPWALLATSSLLKNSSALKAALPVTTKFAVSGVQKVAAAS
ncbi:MAG: hypothetical protein JO061_19365 [Acidobacteriaceae bacterium]|nr:hypothetical protein [Acidobacteriaceae bacterium]